MYSLDNSDDDEDDDSGKSLKQTTTLDLTDLLLYSEGIGSSDEDQPQGKMLKFSSENFKPVL